MIPPAPIAFPQWLAEALFASTLLMAAVMALRGPARRLFGARVAYALWLLPALRMMLPRLAGPEAPHLHLRLDLSALSHSAAAPPGVVAMGIMPPLPHAPAPPWPGDLVAALVTLWLAGAILHFAWHVAAHRRFMARALAGAAPVTRECGIAVLAAPGVEGPLATGLFRRLVLLPGDFAARYSPAERRLVLAHEVAHHVRGDLFANMAALVLLSLHWFDPIAHRAYRAFRHDQELACDGTVLANEPADARPAYGLAVVKSAGRRFPAAVCAMHPAGLLKRRLKMMTMTRPGTARTIAGIAMAAAIVGGGLFLTASGGAAAERAGEIAPPVATSVIRATSVTPAAPVAAPAPTRDARIDRRRIDRRRIVVDGREVSPASPEGRRALAEADAATARAGEAGRQAALAMSRIDVAAVTRAAFASARTGLAAACSGGARPLDWPDDRAAIADAARSCADSPAIRAEIRRALADARREIARARELTDRERDRALLALDGEAARAGWDRAD